MPPQVEPVQWSEKRQRKVLNAAVSSVVTHEMIRAANFAVTTGYCGSLSRRTSSRHEVILSIQFSPMPGGCPTTQLHFESLMHHVHVRRSEGQIRAFVRCERRSHLLPPRSPAAARATGRSAARRPPRPASTPTTCPTPWQPSSSPQVAPTAATAASAAGATVHNGVDWTHSDKVLHNGFDNSG